MDFEINHLIEKGRFSAIVDGQEAILSYRKEDESTLNFLSIYVPESLRGGGIAAKIVKHGLEYAKENNFRVLPTCWYVKKYIERHEEYQNMVAD